MEIQNANPTIINTADLPSRRRPKRTKAKGKKASAARRLGAGGDADAAAAFFDYDSSWDPSSFETDGDSGYYEDGEDVGDPIDEQEVFGELLQVGLLDVALCGSSGFMPSLCLLRTRSPPLDIDPWAAPPRSCENRDKLTGTFRSLVVHLRPRASSHIGPTRGGEPSRHPYQSTARSQPRSRSGHTHNRDRGSHTDGQPLQSGHDHRSRGASASGRVPAAKLQARRPHEGRLACAG